MMKTKGYSKGGKMKTKGYAKGGKLDMVEKGGKKVPFYAADGKGKMAAGGEVESLGDGSMSGPISESRKKMLKQMEEDNSAAGYEKRKQKFIEDQKKKPEDKKKKRVTSKDKLANMKSGGKVKTKGYAKGGKVRGAGIAKKGVKACKMR
jgi:hypothetical protein